MHDIRTPKVKAGQGSVMFPHRDKPYVQADKLLLLVA